MSPHHSSRAAAMAGWAIAAACGHATAGMHQICFESEPENGQRTVIVGCMDDDSRGFCRVTGVSNAQATYAGAGGVSPAMPGQLFSYWRATGGTSPVTATVEFVDANRGQIKAIRSCTVHLGSQIAYRGPASRGAYLVGFSTDTSGLVMTGAWRAQFTASGQDIAVPGDFVAVSGGIETDKGAFAERSEWSPLGTWRSKSYTDNGTIPDTTVTHAIGLKIEGLLPKDEFALDAKQEPVLLRRGLESWIESVRVQSRSALTLPEVRPQARAMLPLTSARVALSGEFLGAAHHTNALTLRGQYASVSAPRMGKQMLRCVLVGSVCPPAVATGWRVETKDDTGNHPGHSSAGLLHLPLLLPIGGKHWEVRGKVVRAGSWRSTEPAADVGGLRGTHAVTAIGAEVFWQAFNPNPLLASNRLVKLQPRLDLGGASVAGRHGSIVTEATVDAYAMGIQLVPEGTPPAPPEPPIMRSTETVFLPWLCDAFAGLEGWRGCEARKVMKLGAICSAYPDLGERGLCDTP